MSLREEFNLRDEETFEDAARRIKAERDELAEALKWFVDRRATITSKFQLYGPKDIAEAMIGAFSLANAALRNMQL